MPEYDLIIRNGTLYDGSGQPPITGDVAINGDMIAAVGELPADASGKTELDVNGLAVAPGFINMLSWSTESLIEDGRSQSEIRQGVTLQIMGEGASMGPLSDEMKATGPGSYMAQGHITYDVEWTTLGEYLEWLEKRGVSCNIASFVGSATLRIHAMGYDNREPSLDELGEMDYLLRQAMEEGAMGLSAALIYPPATYADYEELVDLVSILKPYGGMYISHIRSEGEGILDAVDEFLGIVEEAGVTGEIYHLKAAGQAHWDKLDKVIEVIEAMREDGFNITADMYTYPYSGTGLASCIPPWAHEGGHDALLARLRDPETRERIKADMNTPSDQWENMFLDNPPENILLSGFKKDEMKHLQGKRLSEVMAERGTSAADTVLDLITEDESRIFTIYFSMSEDNLRKQVALPWVSFCSDAESQAPEGVFLSINPHPRAYGSFARLLAKYVRDEGIIPLEEAVRRLTAFPAANLKLKQRGWLREGHYADVVVFDPATIQDHATPKNPHQYATGMVHVFVNGEQVLRDGEHTGAKPGRVVRGPGYQQPPFGFDYPEALHPFLTLGDSYNGMYTEFNIGRQYIPDLIRMATSTDLHFLDENEPHAFAPMHAWRRLAQLGATEAVEPLTAVLGIGNPLLVVDELPLVFATFGAAALPALRDHLMSPWNIPFSRAMATNCIREVAERNDEDAIYTLAEAILTEQLEKHAENHPLLNAALIMNLADLKAVNAAPVIGAAFATGNVDEGISGTWEEVRGRLGLLRSPILMGRQDDFYDDEPRSAGAATRKADSKKKAKRKQAAKIKKQNRKKRR